ncbi:hypothetical protein I4U23_009184 [Adineta vaga]|nr:hypothetical protein I4U23_009184 [Adineta vaga]
MSSPSAYVVTLSTTIRYISLTINFITLIIGTFGALCNLITFTSPQLRRNACIFYLVCATTFQLLSILFIVPSRMALDSFGSNLERESIIFCKIRYYLVVTLPELATYYILLSIMDRCLATSACYCQTVPSTFYTTFVAGYTLAVVIVIPHAFMLILSIITFLNMKRTRQRVAPASNTLHQRQTHRFESHIIMVIILQVVVSSILLLLRIGSYLYSVFTSGNLNRTLEERVAEGFALQLGVSLYYLSFALAFYVSTLTSKYFREIFSKRISDFYRHLHGAG